MAVVLFRDDDPGYVAWVTESPQGYVLNMQRSLSAGDARMHTASCAHLARAIDASASAQRRLTTTYIKVCSPSVDELDEWSANRVGAQIKRCPSCLGPGRPAIEPTRSARDTQARRPGLPYGLYRIRVAHNEISLDAPRYLPFERLDEEQLQARARLRTALAGLTAGPGEVLHAWYSGPRPPNSDVENLVLYNIDSGGSSVIRASTSGVRFELDSRRPDRGARCLYRYRVVSTEDPLISWQPGPCLARFAGAELGAFLSEHRLAQTWMAVHGAAAETHGLPSASEGPFGIYLDLEAPPSARPGVRPELLKALIDGVVSAFQAHLDKTTVLDMASRIANEINVDPYDVTTRLLASDRAVLGSRHSLVHSRGKGVQWNPSDHLCVAGQVLRHPGDRWRLSGEIYLLAPAPVQMRRTLTRVSSVVRSLRRRWRR